MSVPVLRLLRLLLLMLLLTLLAGCVDQEAVRREEPGSTPAMGSAPTPRERVVHDVHWNGSLPHQRTACTSGTCVGARGDDWQEHAVEQEDVVAWTVHVRLDAQPEDPGPVQVMVLVPADDGRAAYGRLQEEGTPPIVVEGTLRLHGADAEGISVQVRRAPPADPGVTEHPQTAFTVTGTLEAMLR